MTNPSDPAHGFTFTKDDRVEPGFTKRELFAKDILCSLLSNPERYKYIAGKIERKELTQDEATAKNVNKALLITDALIRGLNTTAENQK